MDPAPPSVRLRDTTGPVSSERADHTPSLPAPPVGDRRVQQASVVVVALIACAAAAWIASAMWSGLLFGLLTAFAVEPVHQRLVRALGGRRALAATLVLTVVTLAITGLLVGVLLVLANEAASGVAAFKEWLPSASQHEPWPSLERSLSAFGVSREVITERISRVSDRAAETVTAFVSLVLGSTFSSIAGALIAVLTAFHVLRDPKPIERRLELFLPLHPRTTRELVDEFRKVGRGTLIGSVLAAICQGLLGGAGYAIMSVPRPLLLGVATFFASFIPVVGTMLVWLPVAIGLMATGHIGAGVFEIVWGFVITSGLVDYGLRPVLAGKESRSHPLLFIIGLVGGVEILGAPGIIAGPIVMTVFASAIGIYRREVLEAGVR
ncbi:MAG TPA: AI-2E family transporter [Byssovorax sp.]|jgi:predicted PurR-regulated permease PerM